MRGDVDRDVRPCFEVGSYDPDRNLPNRDREAILEGSRFRLAIERGKHGKLVELFSDLLEPLDIEHKSVECSVIKMSIGCSHVGGIRVENPVALLPDSTGRRSERLAYSVVVE